MTLVVFFGLSMILAIDGLSTIFAIDVIETPVRVFADLASKVRD